MSFHMGSILLIVTVTKALIDPNTCFNGGITSQYSGDSLSGDNLQWLDISGNNNHATIAGSGVEVFDGIDNSHELYLNGKKTLFGTTATRITFEPSLPATRTLIHLCKYRDVGTARRIIQAQSYNFLSGFYQGRSGVAHDNAWITTDTQRFKRRWVLSSQTRELYRGNGIDFTTWPRTGVVYVSKLTINTGVVSKLTGAAASHTSDFSCAEVILIDQMLDQNEIECIEGYFNEKYALKATNNPNNCMSNVGSLAGWYSGGSFDVANDIWEDLSGVGYLNNVIVAGTALTRTVETNTADELYLNNGDVIYGTTATDVTFPAILEPDHSVFSVCRYRSTYKRRIIQAEDWSGIFGFHNGHSGAAYEVGWITSSTLDRFPGQWVISAQTNDLYRANLMDFTQGSGGNIAYTRLMINKGAASTEQSNFACAEIIIINEVLQNQEIQCIENYLNSKYDIVTLPTENPGNCLQHPLNLAAWYDADSFDVNNNIWNDKSGAGYPGIIGGTGIAVFDGVDTLNELYMNNQKVVTGTTATTIKFDRWISGDSTTFNLCKYMETGTKGRIIQSETFNGAYGFISARSGNAHITAGHIANTLNNFGTNWVLSTVKHDLYRANNIDLTATPRAIPHTTKLMINSGAYYAQDSTWACAEIIAVNENLSTAEISCLENYFNTKYGLLPQENPGQCLTDPTKLRGWYDPNSFDEVNNIWKDKSGYGYNNDGIVSGAGGIQLFDGSDISNELYINGEKVIDGATTTKIKFNPMLQPQHSIFNLCKYKQGGTKGRILQAEKYNALYGFYNGLSGVTVEFNNWITQYSVDQFSTKWLLSYISPQPLYRGNFVDLTTRTTPAAVTLPTTLMINSGHGAAGGQTSDFDCTEVIMVDAIVSDTERICMENYFQQRYGLLPTNNPGSCLTNPTNLAGWYNFDDADASKNFDSVNGMWKDKSGVGYFNDAIVEGSAHNIERETNNANELFLEGNKVLTGTIDTKITFSPIVSREYSVFSVCKYRDGSSNKKRIIQAETYDAIFGFYEGNSGVAHEGRWMTQNIDRFGTNWVVSAQTNDKYRANGIDYTTGSSAALPVTRLMINKGRVPTHTSDFACAEVIIVNEKVSDADLLCIEEHLNDKYSSTLNPTQNPTKTPTKNPTRNPTRDPTIKPTDNPTIAPTKGPTREPTKQPTFEPCTTTTAPMNIEFVIDESGSINAGAGNENNYAQSIDFVIDLIQNSVNSESKVAAMSFATDNQFLHRFNQQQDSRVDIINALELEKEDYAAQWTDTYNAIVATVEEFSDVQQIPATDENKVFLVTDGIPYCNGDCEENVCGLKSMIDNAGIDLFVIGVTAGFNRSKLDCLVDETLPTDKRVFLLGNFTHESFKRVEESVRTTILCPETVVEEMPSAKSINQFQVNDVNNNNNINNNQLIFYDALIAILTPILTLTALIVICYGFYRCKSIKSKTIKYEKVNVNGNENENDQILDVDV